MRNKLIRTGGESMRKTLFTTIIPSIVIYIILLVLYLFDIIGALIFLGILLLSILIIGILFVICYKNSKLKRSLRTSIITLSVLFAFEFPLLFYLSAPAFSVQSYHPPVETVAGSGIFTIGVVRFDFEDEKSEESIHKLLTDQGIDVLSIIKIDNQILYGVKNRQLVTWLHLRKEHTPKEMVETVQSYLGAKEDWMSQLSGSDTGGDSAGLSLVLSGLFKRGDLENQLPIAVTGGINKQGKVTKVGYINEKLKIIEKEGITIAFMPSENKNEAMKLHKKLKLKVDLFFVSDVEEAQRKIDELNMHRKSN